MSHSVRIRSYPEANVDEEGLQPNVLFLLHVQKNRTSRLKSLIDYFIHFGMKTFISDIILSLAQLFPFFLSFSLQAAFSSQELSRVLPYFRDSPTHAVDRVSMGEEICRANKSQGASAGSCPRRALGDWTAAAGEGKQRATIGVGG